MVMGLIHFAHPRVCAEVLPTSEILARKSSQPEMIVTDQVTTSISEVGTPLMHDVCDRDAYEESRQRIYRQASPPEGWYPLSSAFS